MDRRTGDANEAYHRRPKSRPSDLDRPTDTFTAKLDYDATSTRFSSAHPADSSDFLGGTLSAQDAPNNVDEASTTQVDELSARSSAADLAMEAFGGVARRNTRTSGSPKIPGDLEETEMVTAEYLSGLYEQLHALQSGKAGFNRVSRGDLYKTFGSLKEALHGVNVQIRDDRDKGRSLGSRVQRHQACRTPGRIIFGPVSQALGDSKVPVTDESHVSTPTGDDSRKVRPQCVLQPMKRTILTIVGGSRSDTEMTQRWIDQNPRLVEQFVRLVAVGKPVNRLHGENKPLVVDSGDQLRRSAVLDLSWLNIIRYEDVVSTSDAQLAQPSAEYLIEFLLEERCRSLKSLAASYGLEIRANPTITKTAQSRFEEENSCLRDYEEEQLTARLGAAHRSLRTLSIAGKQQIGGTSNAGNERFKALEEAATSDVSVKRTHESANDSAAHTDEHKPEKKRVAYTPIPGTSGSAMSPTCVPPSEQKALFHNKHALKPSNIPRHDDDGDWFTDSRKGVLHHKAGAAHAGAQETITESLLKGMSKDLDVNKIPREDAGGSDQQS